MNITQEQLDKMKTDLLCGLKDGSIKTIEFSSYHDYLEKIYESKT